MRHKPATSGAFASFALSPDERCIAVGTTNGGHIVVHACHFGFCDPISVQGDGGPYSAQRAAAAAAAGTAGTAAAAAAGEVAAGGRGRKGVDGSGGVGDLLDFSGSAGASGGLASSSRGRVATSDLLDFDFGFTPDANADAPPASAFAFIGGDAPATATPPALDPLTALYAAFASHTDRVSPLMPLAAAATEMAAAPFAAVLADSAAGGGDRAKTGADPFAFAALDKIM